MSIITGFTVQPDGRAVIPKDPEASLLYGIDVAGLLASGDAVSAVTVGSSSGVTAGTPTFTGTVLSVRVSGGAAGTTGSVTLRWTTTGGDTDERTMWFAVAQR